ncbi:electron transport complex subunit RsxG [Thiococcus pfennigii]|jgi:electron transport complex protein RnfG|uniref:electron transport complex subunit RsxG n=1 Tax=Thiococcus pfennigii TaxID=1057 RepID=UPI001907B1F5|nr:electron transport complex subunit RsxG [Thiococcus pfennigii]MBK1730932.1 electron transport complex subunit RsxG [Thiococcus pfennigii]
MTGARDTGAGWRERISYQALLLGGFSLLAAALLTVGDLVTRDPIAARRAEDLQASLSQVLPPAIHDNDLLAAPLTLTDEAGRPRTVYRALRGLQVTGIAFRTSGLGYAGPIDILVGIDAEGRVLGARVLAHAETPGLGDKIEIARDDWILAFDGRSLGDPPLERWAVAKDEGDFDQFTGATITPRAVVDAIKGALLFFAAHRDTLTAAAVITEPAPEAPLPR